MQRARAVPLDGVSARVLSRCEDDGDDEARSAAQPAPNCASASAQRFASPLTSAAFPLRANADNSQPSKAPSSW